jgi:hypothetical protein
MSLVCSEARKCDGLKSSLLIAQHTPLQLAKTSKPRPQRGLGSVATPKLSAKHEPLAGMSIGLIPIGAVLICISAKGKRSSKLATRNRRSWVNTSIAPVRPTSPKLRRLAVFCRGLPSEAAAGSRMGSYLSLQPGPKFGSERVRDVIICVSSGHPGTEARDLSPPQSVLKRPNCLNRHFQSGASFESEAGEFETAKTLQGLRVFPL